MKKQTLAMALGLAAVLPAGAVFAKTTLETVKTPSGAEIPKVRVEGQVTSVSETGKNQIQVKEADGKTYAINLGPKWFKDTTVSVGDNVKVEGLEKTEGTIGAWKLTKADGSEVTIRTQAGRPEWAGKGKGQGNGQRKGSRQGFVDENKDGVCDHQQQ